MFELDFSETEGKVRRDGMVLLLNAPALVIIGSTLEGTHTRADRHIQPRYGHTLSLSSASSSRYLTNKLLSKASSSIERHA